MSANITCWQGLQPPAQVVSGHISLDLTKQGEMLLFRCEGNTTLYSDVTLRTQPEIYCSVISVPNGGGNSETLNSTWLCQATENTNVSIWAFNKQRDYNHEKLMDFDIQVHDLEDALRATPAPCVPTSDYTTDPTTGVENAGIVNNQQNSQPSTNEPTTATETTTAKEYPLYVVLCALLIPLLVVAGVVILLIVVVMKCHHKNKMPNDPESVQMGKLNSGNDDQQNTSHEVQDETINQTISSNVGDTSSDNLTPI